ncbi:hypothetical protein KUCAC02_012017 [Chaenocephalus aceratus]|uniref:Uncharacterized protein n=1 Tax=Chaenocephalus aceratus TaxID=36190 RepID=A0ACB9XAN1_CHAAC|nr:hypothetical protein KUCAC02_012017 [Chaenocephalus aceratus]
MLLILGGQLEKGLFPSSIRFPVSPQRISVVKGNRWAIPPTRVCAVELPLAACVVISCRGPTALSKVYGNLTSHWWRR